MRDLIYAMYLKQEVREHGSIYSALISPISSINMVDLLRTHKGPMLQNSEIVSLYCAYCAVYCLRQKNEAGTLSTDCRKGLNSRFMLMNVARWDDLGEDKGRFAFPGWDPLSGSAVRFKVDVALGRKDGESLIRWREGILKT